MWEEIQILTTAQWYSWNPLRRDLSQNKAIRKEKWTLVRFGSYSEMVVSQRSTLSSSHFPVQNKKEPVVKTFNLLPYCSVCFKNRSGWSTKLQSSRVTWAFTALLCIFCEVSRISEVWMIHWNTIWPTLTNTNYQDIIKVAWNIKVYIAANCMNLHSAAQHLTSKHLGYLLVSELIIGTISHLSVFHLLLEVCRIALLAADLLVDIVVVMRSTPFKKQPRYSEHTPH